MKFKWLRLVFSQLVLMIILEACSGGSCLPDINNGVVLGVLPTGATVLINNSHIQINNLTPESANLSISGGPSGVEYELWFSESMSGITVSPTKCLLSNISGSSSCTITFEPNFASNGVYSVHVYYSVVNVSNSSNKLASHNVTNNSLPNPISVVLSGSSQARLIYPESNISVGVGTPIIVQFNNPVMSSSINDKTFYVSDSLGNQVPPESIVVAPDQKSAMFVVTSSFANPLSVNTKYSVQLTNGIVDLSQHPIMESSFSFSTQESAYKTYLTASSYNGNLLNYANTLQSQVVYSNGIAAADYLCQIDSNRPDQATYKAVIVDNLGNRNAYPIAINWVMQPYALYSNVNESPLFITGINPADAESNLIPTFSAAVSDVTFSTYWLNTLTSSPRPNYNSGVLQNWTTNPLTCQSWTSSVATDYRVYARYKPLGFPVNPYLSGVQLYGGGAACSLTTYSLLCVQQP